MVKIRLKQIGKKGQKSYRICVMDSQRWRNGIAIDEIGFYNPQTNPSEITIDEAKYVAWVAKGAQPTAMVASIFKNVTAKTK